MRADAELSQEEPIDLTHTETHSRCEIPLDEWGCEIVPLDELHCFEETCVDAAHPRGNESRAGQCADTGVEPGCEKYLQPKVGREGCGSIEKMSIRMRKLSLHKGGERTGCAFQFRIFVSGKAETESLREKFFAAWPAGTEAYGKNARIVTELPPHIAWRRE
jgi:hypothetical protein